MQELIDKYPTKTTFIFELDNVIFPAKDYDLQVYYLFGQFMEFTLPGIHESKRILDFLVLKHGTMPRAELIDTTIEHFAIPPDLKENFERLFKIARLPLKLLMFKQTLEFMQTLVTDRKRLFILAEGEVEEELNKIKQIEWNGLENYLKVYFIEESEGKNFHSTFDRLVNENQLSTEELLWVSNQKIEVPGITVLPVSDLVKV
ncbi:hypothetical protein [Solitalea lacus]|uniref:hypothetical protein n=1 Tax=Solitalea lacus TaxID=2911172 RepID=UPI001EDA32B4|nr:hypothetical protein [Solitalea lacus]UKJ06159.1 hypothetical protein L2B55_11475 [Solitalea lacus]